MLNLIMAPLCFEGLIGNVNSSGYAFLITLKRISQTAFARVALGPFSRKSVSKLRNY